MSQEIETIIKHPKIVIFNAKYLSKRKFPSLSVANLDQTMLEEAFVLGLLKNYLFNVV